MKLIDSIIKSAKAKKQPYSLADGGGLVMLVQVTGAKWWRFRYRFQGKAKMRFPRYFVCHQVNFMQPFFPDFAYSANIRYIELAIGSQVLNA
ncbi:MAG: DUF4102 domain-containing protein, partial [Ottowia sp.]|nr:DUF4102 domain-containing protein [Ottowia sp.]